MDEREWLSCTTPSDMLDFLQKWELTSGRKERLYTCACCRRVWRLLTDERSREAVECAELLADERLGRRGLAAAQARAREAFDALIRGRVFGPREAAAEVAFEVLFEVYGLMGFPVIRSRTKELSDRDYCTLIREIFGNPFRPIALDPGWRTPVVLALAHAAYDNRALPAGALEPDRLAVLADAIEEAGCTDADILGHLRGPGPHVRGCFVIDALLDKK